MFKDQKLYDSLAESSLLSELKPRKVAPGDTVGETPFKDIYYGVGCSGAREPVDQIAGFLLAKRAREFYGTGKFVPFIAGKYDILNCGSENDLEWMARDYAAAEARKREEYRFLMRYLGLDGEVLVAADLWRDPAYWDSVEDMLGRFPGIIPPPLGCSLSFNEIPLELVGPVGKALRSKIGKLEAARLYVLFEVAEAKYISGKYSIDAKIGPQSEQMYDVFINDFLNVAQYLQPVDLETRPQRVKTVCPYRAGQYQPRLYFTEDSEEEVEEKLRRAARRCSADPPEVADPKTGARLLNPVVQSAVFAVETARALKETPVRICGVDVGSGSDVVKLAAGGVQQWAESVTRLVWDYLIRPFKEWWGE